jgi:hypothetical protein
MTSTIYKSHGLDRESIETQVKSRGMSFGGFAFAAICFRRTIIRNIERGDLTIQSRDLGWRDRYPAMICQRRILFPFLCIPKRDACRDHYILCLGEEF